jgi:hypothetical protein
VPRGPRARESRRRSVLSALTPLDDVPEHRPFYSRGLELDDVVHGSRWLPLGGSRRPAGPSVRAWSRPFKVLVGRWKPGLPAGRRRIVREMKSWASASALAAVTFALSGCGSASGKVPAPSAPPCASQPTGALCIKVFQSGHAVRDVIGYLSASESPLAGRTWRLTLSRYACDPGSDARPHCRAAGKYPGPTRHGRPPLETSCRENGSTTTTPRGCHDTLAQETASFGDWSGFGVPKKFATRTWLCVSEEIRVGGVWRQPAGALATQPARSCKSVGPT